MARANTPTAMVPAPGRAVLEKPTISAPRATSSHGPTPRSGMSAARSGMVRKPTASGPARGGVRRDGLSTFFPAALARQARSTSPGRGHTDMPLPRDSVESLASLAPMSLGVWLREVADGLGHLLALLAPFAPYATAFAAFVAAMIALSSLSHRRRADSRAEWWRRVEYAMDLTREEGKVGRNTGMQLLTHLLDDRRWDEVDVKMPRKRTRSSSAKSWTSCHWDRVRQKSLSTQAACSVD